uniref:NAD-dependent epimerase/dehydratase domain-containing protein n=1 Tax=Arcella intermedia TaxID=1963864 RepID=A0A6B2L8V2_9EUKA
MNHLSTSGGRSSVSGAIATVFGSTGFLGRYVVSQLGRIGTQVVVPWRGEEKSYTHLKVMGDVGQIVPYKWDIRDKNTMIDASRYSNIIVNAAAQRWDTRNFSLKDVNVEGARAIAEVAKELDVERFFHISALGASPDAESDWLRSKWEGEEIVRKTFPKATILRPAVMFGAQDNFLNVHAQMLRYWPVYPMVHPNKRLQPVWVNDVATAILASIKNPDTIGKTFEIGGSHVYQFHQIIDWMNKVLKVDANIMESPDLVTWHLGYWLEQIRKPKFTLDAIKETKDVVCSGQYPGLKELGIAPTPLTSQRSIGFIIHYRPPIRQLDVTLEQEELPEGIKEGEPAY